LNHVDQEVVVTLGHFLMDNEANKPNKLDTALQQWWDSDACKKIQKEHEESLQRSVGKYYMLSPQDKYDIVQALCHIICKAEREGTSHRGLMDTLGIYPEGFWIDDLMTVHNALWTEFESVTKD
jgi:hypothetical protein